MSFTVCACVVPANLAVVKSVLDQHLMPAAAKNVIYGQSADAFASAKSSGHPIALLVETGIAHDVIKDLCDDYNQTKRRVRFIYSLSAGVDAYRLSELTKELHGIPMHNAQGCYSNVLAEHVVFSMLYFNRFPWRLVASKNEKKWDRFNMIEIQEQKVVVIGYGDIGQACGQKAAALGMKVTGIRRSGDNMVDKHGVMVRGNDALDEAIREADFVVGVLPGTVHTTHFFNKDVFAKMKPSAVFINIGRGQTQCEADIVDALNNGVIRGAALDVFETEPLPKESPLWNLPDDKLLLTSHCADWTDHLMQRTTTRFTDIYTEYATKDKSDAYRVHLEKGY
ncbi:D-isomer specific 2-hydroxyacid dehydrogenase NAD binding domain protein [Lotmaria passim]